MAKNGSRAKQLLDKIEHIEGDRFKAPPIENPVSKALNVTVSVPESIEIKMVDASVLSDYEVWGLVASISASGFVGFLVAYFQASQSNQAPYYYMTITIGVLFIISVIMTAVKRHKLRKRSKCIKLRATEILEENDNV
jgi:hypothetical protein